MTRVLAMETAAYDIKVNVHYPGALRTDMNPRGEGKPEDAVSCAIDLAPSPKDGPTGRTFGSDKEIRFSHKEAARPGDIALATRASIGTSSIRLAVRLRDTVRSFR